MKLPSCEDYEVSIDTAPLIKAAELQGGYVEKIDDVIIRYVGGFCIVFPYFSNGKKHAVRCWIANVDNAQERTRIIAESLSSVNLPYFVDFKYVENAIATSEGLQPIVIMDWVEADTLKEYIEKHINNHGDLLQLAENFKRMVQDLHQYKFSHGDLQHGNILVREDGTLVLVDYDSMYVPQLEGYTDDIKGLTGYQHPGRCNHTELSAKSDYFSELVIYTSIIALAYYPELWYELQMKDTETLIYSADDIKSNGTSSIFKLLSNDVKSAGLLPKLVQATKEALSKCSIDELLPLEEALVTMRDTIRSRWNKPVVEEPNEPFVPQTISTRNRWNTPLPESNQNQVEIDSESVRKKWQ